MEEIKIMAPGEKLKLIRRNLGLLQEEVAGQDVSRNFISMIENGKLKLNQRTARILYQNLLTAPKRKGKPLNITFEELFQDELDQVCKILDKYNQTLHEHMDKNSLEFENILEEVEVFLLSWDIKEKKLLIYETTGDYYNLNGEFSRGVDYYLKALECIGKNGFSPEFLELTIKLARIYIKLKRFEDGIQYMNYLMNYEKDVPKGKLISLIFNRALCNKNLQNYNKVLEDLNKLENLLDKTDIDKIFDVLILKANCYLELDRFDEALNVYESILGIIDEGSSEKYIITVLNIAKVYINMDKYNEVNNYLKKALGRLDCIGETSDYKTKIYLEIAGAFAYLRSYYEADAYYSKAYECAEHPSQQVYRVDVLTGMLGIALDSGNWERIDIIDTELKYLIATNLMQKDAKIIFRLLKAYNEKGKKNKVDELLTYILNSN